MKGHKSHSVYVSLILLILPTTALAAPIPGLVNTGQGLAPGAQDFNYAGGSGSFAVNPHSDGVWSWLGAVGTLPANTQWITQNHIGAEASQGLFNSSYNYSLSFNLSGLDPASAVINFKFAVDNNLEVRLNGTLVDSLILGPTANTTFNSLHDGITITAGLLQGLGSAFLAGLNTLEFRVFNLGPEFGPNPEGLLVAISGTANPATQEIGPVNSPEPASVALWACLASVGALVIWRRRIRLAKLATS